MKKIFAIALFACLGVQAFSQQDVFLNQFFYNKLSINPAFAGMDKLYNAAIIGRDQWDASPGNPTTLMFTGDAYLSCANSGIGINAYNNKLGFESNSEIKLSYSKHFTLDKGTLGIGASIGYYTTSISGEWNSSQGNTLVSVGKTTYYDAGFGLYYANEQGFYIGFSASHLPEKLISSANVLYQSTEMPHYYSFMTGYSCALSTAWDIIPEVLLESSSGYSMTQIDLRVQYNKIFWFGAGYSAINYYSALIGFNIFTKNISSLKLGYSYNFVSPQPAQFSSGGTHELVLQYSIRPKAKS